MSTSTASAAPRLSTPHYSKRLPQTPKAFCQTNVTLPEASTLRIYILGERHLDDCGSIDIRSLVLR